MRLNNVVNPFTFSKGRVTPDKRQRPPVITARVRPGMQAPITIRQPHPSVNPIARRVLSKPLVHMHAHHPLTFVARTLFPRVSYDTLHTVMHSPSSLNVPININSLALNGKYINMHYYNNAMTKLIADDVDGAVRKAIKISDVSTRDHLLLVCSLRYLSAQKLDKAEIVADLICDPLLRHQQYENIARNPYEPKPPSWLAQKSCS